MIDNFPAGWIEPVKEELDKPYFKELSHFLESEYASPHPIFPEKKDIFNAFVHCAFDNVKVVILGQDPYPTPGHANGLCFSVNPGTPLPKSLKNIFTELGNDLNIVPPVNGDLTRWASQGVFLLNTVLTVRSGLPNSHQNRGWEKFTDAMITKLSEQQQNLVFLLWGKPAQKKKTLIDENRHFILEAPHPSPLSAYRGFFGCKHFSKTNLLLQKADKKTIEW